MAYGTISLEKENRVAILTFRRGDQLNAMNNQMMGEITKTMLALSDDPSVGCIIMTGEGRAFMAGADIKEYAAQSQAEFEAFQQNGNLMYRAVEENRKPVIAAVNGYALGGGFEFVLACDIVIASRHAKMGLPEIKIGLIPGGGGTVRSVQKLGTNLSKFLTMTGDAVPAAEFLASGLVNVLVDPEALMPRARAIAATIAAEPPDAIEGLKRVIDLAQNEDTETALANEQTLIFALNKSEIAKERVKAFAARSEKKGKA